MSFPNVIQGAYATPFETGSVALYPIGQRMETPNGRVFRYAEMGATVGVAASLYQSEVPSPQWDTMAITTAITAASSTQVSYTNGTTAAAENELENGYLIVEETDDLGETHRIAGNISVGSGAVGTVYLFPGDVFQVTVAVAANNVITVVKNPYKDIILTIATAQTAMPAGVPQVLIAADAYGWVQTHGIASCLIEGTVVIGQEGRPSETVAGSVTAMDYDEANDGNLGAICRIVEVAPTTDFCTVFLTLEGLT